MKSENFARYFAEIEKSWKEMAIMGAGTIGISIIYIFLLRWITKPLLYLSMLAIQIGFILLGAWSWMKKDEFLPEQDEYYYCKVGAGLSWGFAGVYFCFVCCCWSNIALGASIMEAAADFVTSNLRIVLLPIMSYLVCIPVIVYWVFASVYVFSIGEVEFEKNSFIANIKWDNTTKVAMWYLLFGLLWIIAFLICLQQFIIAAMTCMWYFSGQGAEMSDQAGTVSLWMAFKWGAWYHQGSIAFGSFCIALVTMIRIVFEYLAKKYESVGNKDNVVYKAVTCCMRCVLWCLDKYVKFITKNAFIQIALSSNSFCASAWQSFYLIVRHAGRFTSASTVGWIMMMLGKGTIIALSSLCTFLIVRYRCPDVTLPYLPAIIIGAVAYLVGSLFLSIFSFSCTAILHSFILDEDTGGSKFSPESLKPFLDYNDEQRAKKKKNVDED
jgi:hypothetical protein